MNVEYTARKYVITPNIRKEVETGLNKIRKILGDRFETKVVLGVEKRQHKAEITIDPPNGRLSGWPKPATWSLPSMRLSITCKKQALKYKTKWLSKEAQGGQEV